MFQHTCISGADLRFSSPLGKAFFGHRYKFATAVVKCAKMQQGVLGRCEPPDVRHS